MDNFLSLLAGALISGLTTFAVSRFYYRKASDDLRNEAATLRQASSELRQEVNDLRGYNIIMLRLFDDIGKKTGLIGVNFDSETGEPVGLDLKRTAVSSVGSSDSTSQELRDSSSSSAEESNDK